MASDELGGKQHVKGIMWCGRTDDEMLTRFKPLEKMCEGRLT